MGAEFGEAEVGEPVVPVVQGVVPPWDVEGWVAGGEVGEHEPSAGSQPGGDQGEVDRSRFGGQPRVVIDCL